MRHTKRWCNLLLTMALFANVDAMASVGNCLDELVAGGVAADFGYDLAASQDLVAVGEPSADRVHVFQGTADGVWTLLRTIRRPGGLAPGKRLGYGFGHAIGLWRDRLVIGDFVEAPSSDPRIPSDEGWIRRSGVYLSDLSEQPPSLRPLVVDRLPPDAVHGYAVAIGSSHMALAFRRRLASGAWQSEVATAAVATPAQWQTLAAPTPHGASEFGSRLAIDGSRLLVASVGDRPIGAYLYDLVTGARRRLPGEMAVSPDLFTGDVALSGRLAILGGRRRGPTTTASAVLHLEGTDAGRVQTVRPGGLVAVSPAIAVVAPEVPRVPGVLNPRVPTLPTLIAVSASGAVREVTLPDPLTREPLRDAGAVAISRSHVVLGLASSKAACKVVAFPLTDIAP